MEIYFIARAFLYLGEHHFVLFTTYIIFKNYYVDFWELQMNTVFPNSKYITFALFMCVLQGLWAAHGHGIIVHMRKIARPSACATQRRSPRLNRYKDAHVGTEVLFASDHHCLSLSFLRMVSCQIPQRSSDWSPVLGGRLTRLINASVLISRWLKGGSLHWQHSTDVLKF